jgi:hypothetical protein
MYQRKSPVLMIVLAFVLQAWAVTSASAHTVFLVAEGTCVADTLQITYTASSDGYAHNNVVVSFNSVQVDSGAFTAANSFQFSDTLNAPGAPGDTVSVTAVSVGPWVDGFGGGQSASVAVTLPDPCGTSTPGVGRFTGGGKSIDTATGLKVTKGFTIHCDLILSNNLEINWPGASGRTNQFHMLEHTSADCSDDPAIDQRPPVAPVDRIDGVGTGRYNGETGYTVEFTLIDAGEPGTSDQIGFRVFNTTTGVTVLTLPLQNIVGGNVQAHYDQPHK